VAEAQQEFHSTGSSAAAESVVGMLVDDACDPEFRSVWRELADAEKSLDFQRLELEEKKRNKFFPSMGHLIDIRNMSLLRSEVVNEDFTGFHLVKEHPRNVPCCEMPITGLSDLFF
jgi:hypothetical protein